MLIYLLSGSLYENVTPKRTGDLSLSLYIPSAQNNAQDIVRILYMFMIGIPYEVLGILMKRYQSWHESCTRDAQGIGG